MESTAKPPYGSYVTWRNFVDTIRADGLPSQIDSSVLRNMSGASQSQLKIGLKYLNMIDDDSRPTAVFSDLLEADGEERAQLIAQMLRSSYTFLFDDETGGFDLATATAQQFSDKFRGTGLSGDTLRKAESFFIMLANDAGLPLSKRIVSGRTSGERPRSKPTERKPKTPTSGTPKPPSGQRQETTPPPVAVQRSWKDTYLDMVKDKFPAFDPTWDKELQRAWLEQFGNVAKILKDEETDDVDDSGLGD